MDRDGSGDRKRNPIVPLPPLSDAERACNAGDLLRLIAPLDGQEWNGPIQTVQPNGQIYQAVGLKGRGWDLELVSGSGPKEVRVMNWDLPSYFRILPKRR